MQEPIKDNADVAKRLSEAVANSDNPEEALAKLDPEARELAERIGKQHAEREAIQKRLIEGLSPRGRLRRNAACPCGSGKKFKHCCRRDMLNKIHGVPDPEASENESEKTTDEN